MCRISFVRFSILTARRVASITGSPGFHKYLRTSCWPGGIHFRANILQDMLTQIIEFISDRRSRACHLLRSASKPDEAGLQPPDFKAGSHADSSAQAHAPISHALAATHTHTHASHAAGTPPDDVAAPSRLGSGRHRWFGQPSQAIRHG